MKLKKLNKDKLISIGSPLLFGVFIFILWQTKSLNYLLGVDSFVLPDPIKINGIIFDNLSKINANLKVTLEATLIGLLLGSVLGYLLAVFASVFPLVGKGGIKLVSAFNAVPIIALTPVFINLTKLVSDDVSVRSMIAKIMVITVVSMASMSITSYLGLTETKPFTEDLLKSYGSDKKTILLKLRIPNSIPYVCTALKVSIPSSIITALVSEYFTESTLGIGYQIKSNIALAQYSAGWAYIFVACILGIVMFALFKIIEGIILRHRS